ncbi:MAG: S1C family serine protease [Planctomycetota bacterium]|nr:S1C family serine protease [Planctomycetota bacterium]
MRHIVGDPDSPRARARPALASVVLLALLATAVPPLDAREPEDAAAKRTARLLEVAAKARASVVRIRWKSHRNPKDERVRNAIVVSSAGHLLLAGARPDYRRGTLYAEFANGDTVKAQFVSWDERSGLTLLHVNYRNLEPLRFRPEPPAPVPASNTPRVPGVAPAAPVRPLVPGAVEKTQPKADVVELQLRRPLQTLPIGLPIVMVTGDGAVAEGTVRARDRRISAVNPDTGRATTIGALVEAGMSVLGSDQGSPWLDEHGNVVGLQLATGWANMLPEQRAAARTAGLRPRVTPTAALGIPASVLRVVSPRLVQRKPVRRAGLGIESRPCARAMREHLNGGHGCHVIVSVDARGPAAREGLRPKDIIVRVNGEALRAGSRLEDVLLPFRPGDPVRLTFLRRGSPKTVECELTVR